MLSYSEYSTYIIAERVGMWRYRGFEPGKSRALREGVAGLPSSPASSTSLANASSKSSSIVPSKFKEGNKSQNQRTTSVGDPDNGSFSTLGSGMGKKQDPDPDPG